MSGYLSSKEIFVENKKLIFPNNYIPFQANKRGEQYNLFEIPFLDFSFILTNDLRDSGIYLENHNTKDYFTLYFAKYTYKSYIEYFKLLEKDHYKILKKNNCFTAIKDDKESIDSYIYRENILYHYVGTRINYKYIKKQICGI